MLSLLTLAPLLLAFSSVVSAAAQCPAAKRVKASNQVAIGLSQPCLGVIIYIIADLGLL